MYSAKISAEIISGLKMDELDLHGLTVEEALLMLDRYLNDVYVAGLPRVVRVVHGKGTGMLRQMVRRQLAQHPLVKTYRPGDYGEGALGGVVCLLLYRRCGAG